MPHFTRRTDLLASFCGALAQGLTGAVLASAQASEVAPSIGSAYTDYDAHVHP
jgi:hypothetical protein